MEIKLSTTTCSVATVIFAIIAGYLVAFKAPANASAECVMSPLQSQYAALDTRGRVSFWEDRLANELEILPLNDQQQRIVKKVSQIISADLIEAARKDDFRQSEQGQKLEALQKEITTVFTRTQARELFTLQGEAIVSAAMMKAPGSYEEVGFCNCSDGSGFNVSCCSDSSCSASSLCNFGAIDCGFLGWYRCDGNCRTTNCPPD
ncbi:MAG: bacteriocin fulvocin C-related protein [Pyrinomonadaceae bacterium]